MKDETSARLFEIVVNRPLLDNRGCELTNSVKWRYVAGVSRIKVFDHGLSGYTNHLCRCETCRRGNADYHREYRRKRRAELRRLRRIESTLEGNF